MDFEALKSAIRQSQRLVTTHAALELDADSLDVLEVWASLLDPKAELIEDYPTDPRGPSCLILSYVAGQTRSYSNSLSSTPACNKAGPSCCSYPYYCVLSRPAAS